MASAILSEDIVAACLILAKGDMNVTMGEVIRRFETLQETTGSHFGESETDFRSAFIQLGSFVGGKRRWKRPEYDTSGDPLDIFRGFSLREFIIPVLKWQYFYCNDESEWWCRDRDRTLSDRNKSMRKFFANEENLTPDTIKEFLEKNGWGEYFTHGIMGMAAYNNFCEWDLLDYEVPDDWKDSFCLLEGRKVELSTEDLLKEWNRLWPYR
ncbi:MAG TPA: hypothetical protein VMW63_08010 [Methanoregulaceae archaeon]|nr:hypothetical protein [Methanoregulaceae archaeon]